MPPEPAPLPTVVLVHFGDPNLTLGCLQTLATVEREPHRVVVADHGPSPGLAAVDLAPFAGLLRLEDFSNPGFGAGCNRAAEAAFAAGAPAVWFLNNDARLEEPLLGALLGQARRHPQVALWGTHQVEGGRRLGADRQPGWYSRGARAVSVPGLQGGCVLPPGESLSGASLFVTREAWERLGPWPESHFLYYEDAAWCLRAHRAGLPLVLLDQAVIHTRGTTTGRKSAGTTFYGTRNRLRLLAAQGSRPEVFLEGLYLLQRRFFRGQWSLLVPTWRGIRAALQGVSGRDPRY
ncbi:MAG: glycosyltransferase family 2 protein [Acidobacteria bacterium]|nr:glycosyltransferase family 2 protein [Acidobacteriota bacterium]